jgi:putative ABC transport system permease protein
VACINLAGLLLARLTSRRKEIAVRIALGASRGRVARQLLTEGFLLTFVAGALGAGVAAVAIRVVRNAMPPFVAALLPKWQTLRLDPASFVVAIGAGALTGIAIGLWPAWRSTRANFGDAFKSAARGHSDGGTSRVRQAIVTAEIALAIILLAAAGLLARSVRNMHVVRVGFRADHVLTLRVTTPSDTTSWNQLARRLDALPGVARATAVSAVPYGRGTEAKAFFIDGQASARGVRDRTATVVAAGVDYFAALEIPVTRGRAIDETDRGDAVRAAVIDETLARRVFPKTNPIGHSLMIDSVQWRIVGVSADVRRSPFGAVASSALGDIYLSAAQWSPRSMELAVRTTGEPATVAREVEHGIHEFGRDFAVSNVSPLATVVAEAEAPARVLADSIVTLAVAAVLISSIGLYGTVSFFVARRMREFGIRRALGADARSVRSLVLREGSRLAITGASIGLVGALGAGRIMRAVLVDVSPADATTLAAVTALMCIVGLGAAYGPARRAARADPMVSLRQE